MVRWLESFIKLIKELREERGLSTRQLAEEVGVSQSYLSHLENGRRSSAPSPIILEKLAAALGNVTYATLLKEAGYDELAKAEQIKSVYNDFFDDLIDKEDYMKLYDRVQKLERMNDLKFYLESFVKEQGIKVIQPEYNKRPLTKEECQRILDMLSILFPQYQ